MGIGISISISISISTGINMHLSRDGSVDLECIILSLSSNAIST
jgi:hypothetical protein